MKSVKIMTVAMAVLMMGMMAVLGAPEEKDAPGKNELQVYCSTSLELLTGQLVDEYRKINEGSVIRLVPAGNRAVFANLPEGSMALVNKYELAGLGGTSYFSMVVGRDVLVPVMNAANSHRDLIMAEGMSPYDFSRICTSGADRSWGDILGVSDPHPVHAYAVEGATSLAYLSDFVHADPGRLTGISFLGTESMLQSLAEDPDAIGFCSLAALMKIEGTGKYSSIELLPVDMNGDGKIGTFEDIYNSTSMLSHAVSVGRFPHDLYSRIFVVATKGQAGSAVNDFMAWLLTDGQQTLASAGMTTLGYGERNSRMEQLFDQKRAIASVPVTASPAGLYLVVAGFILLMGVLVFVLAARPWRRQTPEEAILEPGGSALVPGGLFFDRSHTWSFMEKNGLVRIGIDHFLQHVCGPLTRVRMKQAGDRIKRGETFLTLIQNGKRLEIKSPVTGIIREQNKELSRNASLLNTQPYADGWVLMVEPANWITELKSYFMGRGYSDWLKSEMLRLKEFLASTLNLQDPQQSRLVLQDGGEPGGGILESFGPELWEEFQAGFINKSK